MSESTVERRFPRLVVCQAVAKWFRDLNGHAIYAPWIYNRLLEMEEWNGAPPFAYDYARGTLRYTDEAGKEHTTSDRLRSEEGCVHPVVDGRGAALALCALLDIAPRPAHGVGTQVDLCRRALDATIAKLASHQSEPTMRDRSEHDGKL